MTTSQAFKVGDRVRILNEKWRTGEEGTIIKIISNSAFPYDVRLDPTDSHFCEGDMVHFRVAELEKIEYKPVFSIGDRVKVVGGWKTGTTGTIVHPIASASGGIWSPRGVFWWSVQRDGEWGDGLQYLTFNENELAKAGGATPVIDEARWAAGNKLLKEQLDMMRQECKDWVDRYHKMRDERTEARKECERLSRAHDALKAQAQNDREYYRQKLTKRQEEYLAARNKLQNSVDWHITDRNNMVKQRNDARADAAAVAEQRDQALEELEDLKSKLAQLALAVCSD